MTEGASTSEPTLICQMKPDNPCDVDKLMLEVTGVKVDTTDLMPRKLEITTAHSRRERVKDVADLEVRRMLRQDYDLLIDVIADVNAANFPRRIQAEIKGRAYYHGRNCSTQSHAELELKPAGKAPEIAPKTEITLVQPGATMLEMPPTKFFAKPNFMDGPNTQGNPFDQVDDIFGIITMLWNIKAYRTIELVARSCGRRAKEDSRAANLNLRAAVRVFRRSKITVGLAIPALGSFTRSRERNITKQETANTSSLSGGGNLYKNETRQVDHDDGRMSVVGERRLGGTSTQHVLEGANDGDKFTTSGFSERTGSGSTSMGLITREDVEEKLKRAAGFEVVITHNGSKVKGLDAVEKLTEQIEKLGTALTDIKELFNSAPQIGWKFTFDVSVFSGSIVMEWFPKYVPGAKANGRYLAVDWKLQGTIQIEIFNISVGVSFGIDWTAAGTGIVAKIAGDLSGFAKIKAKIALDLFKPHQRITVLTGGKASLKVVGYVSAFGKTLADAELKGEGGIEMINGKLDIHWDKRTCDLTGRLESKPILITGYVRGWLWDTELKPYQVMERKVLKEFT
jgi:hypothetical protein